MKRKPPSLQQRYVLEYLSKQNEQVVEDDKSRADILEIGCSLVRMGKNTVRIKKWEKKWESVVVVIESGGGVDVPDGTVSRYLYPLHNNFHPFVRFEVLEDCGYLEKFGNGEEYVIDGRRYGVKDDVVWAGGRRYLSSEERAKFGSFREFLAKHPERTKRRAII